MRVTTMACLGIFAASTLAFGYTYTVTNNNLDTNGPVITMDNDHIEISIADGTARVLEGITATDSRDGDVTSTLVVENMSNFIEDGMREASIVAFDSDNHIARVTREVTYKDYIPPSFSLDQPLRFPINSHDFLTHVEANDCIDGDITPKIHMTFEEDYNAANAGDVKIRLSVANSMGDVTSLPVTMTIYDPDEERNAPNITLTDYLVYAESGTHFDAFKYISSVYTNGKTYQNKYGRLIVSNRYSTDEDAEEIDPDALIIKDPVRRKPGVYEVEYTAVDFGNIEDENDDLTNTVRLIVIVTPKEGASTNE